MTSLLIGRFQPLHQGHTELVQTLLREGRKVVIALRDGPLSTANPYSLNERQEMFRHRFGEQVSVIHIPEDGGLEVVRGRGVGWNLRTISLEPSLEQVSATSVRAARRKAHGRTLWFFGLPAAGKTTLAQQIVNCAVGYVLLDGDLVRQTVTNFDMGQNARLMHLSYMAFTCRQLNDCGINVAAAFVTPLEQHRVRIRQILGNVQFIWLRCAPEVCAQRDPKGLWKKAARGALPGLTGAGGAWEDPTDSAMIIETDKLSVDQAYDLIKQRLSLVGNGK